MSVPAGAGSRARLRTYILANIGKILTSDHLREASGNASEWARRVRELRTEEGFQILTHNDRADLKPGQYLLRDPKPAPAFERGISKETRAFVLDRNGFTCQMCGAAYPFRQPHIPPTKTAMHLCRYGAKRYKPAAYNAIAYSCVQSKWHDCKSILPGASDKTFQLLLLAKKITAGGAW